MGTWLLMKTLLFLNTHAYQRIKLRYKMNYRDNQIMFLLGGNGVSSVPT